jgi:hypothetical protein
MEILNFQIKILQLFFPLPEFDFEISLKKKFGKTKLNNTRIINETFNSLAFISDFKKF